MQFMQSDEWHPYGVQMQPSSSQRDGLRTETLTSLHPLQICCIPSRTSDLHRKGLGHVAATHSSSHCVQVLHVPGGARLCCCEASADVHLIDPGLPDAVARRIWIMGNLR